MNVWKPSLGRVSLFRGLSSSQPPSPLDIFQAIWSAQPDSFQRSPNPLAPSVANGNLGDVTVGCSVQANRLDLTLSGTPASGIDEQPSIPVIRNGSAFADQITKILTAVRSGGLFDGVLRVAAVVQLGSPASGVREANQNIAATLPRTIRATLESEQDFVLQLNNARASWSTKDVTLNQITKWSVEKLQVLTLGISPGQASQVDFSNPTMVSAEIITSSIAFDYNNAPLSLPIDASTQADLLQELFSQIYQDMSTGGIFIEGINA
jgi:hypothetical protein